MAEMWGEKVKWVSKVTPRILGALSRGTMELSQRSGDGAWVGGCQG